MGEAACKLKIILDGGNGYRMLEGLCDAVDKTNAEMFTDENSYLLIEKLIKIEKLATECQDHYLDIIGYDGPRPQFFKEKHDYPA